MLKIERVDYKKPSQSQQLLQLLDAYARDPMGGGEPLSAEVKRQLLPRLAATPNAVSFIAYQDGEPLGLVNTFSSLSTFAARPLINIHDLAVLPQARGKGVGKALLAAVENYGREIDCCKITLEVLTGNSSAYGLYQALGFEAYELDPEMGQAAFMQKKL